MSKKQRRPKSRYPVTKTVLTIGTSLVLSLLSLGYPRSSEGGVEKQTLEEFANQRPAAAAVTKAPSEPNLPETTAEPNILLNIYDGFEDPNYQMWDAHFIECAEFWNEHYSDVPDFEPLDPNLFKALCLYECRNGNVRAFRCNPAQFGNRGDLGFIAMRDGGEAGIPKGGYDELDGYKPVPPKFRTVMTKDGKTKKVFAGWDFDEEGIMPAEVSSKYAMGYLIQRGIIPGRIIIEKGPEKTYTIKRGDTLSNVARNLGTTVGTICKYSGICNPDKIDIGQVITYRETEIRNAVGFRGYLESGGAVERYNGGGDPDYLQGVLRIYKNSAKAEPGDPILN